MSLRNRIFVAPFLVTTVILTALSSGPAAAWGKFGHVTVCEIAYRTTTDIARERLNELIVAHGVHSSFNRACLFADRFPRTRPFAHFINYPRTLESIEDETCPGNRECLISAIEDDFYILSDAGASDAVRGKALIELGHWVGDIHQPLHVSFSDDRGGNMIDKSGRCAASNLHAVWDNCIVERRVLLSKRLAQERGWSTFTRSYRAADHLLEAVSEDDIEDWLSAGVVDWARESFDIVRQPDLQYCVKTAEGCAYTKDNLTLDAGEAEKVVIMNDGYLDRYADVASVQLVKAGIRLGAMLTEALGNQK